jgi:hypothetical protein
MDGKAAHLNARQRRKARIDPGGAVIGTPNLFSAMPVEILA